MSRGPYVQLRIGTCWYFCDPRPEDVRFGDFRALADLNRYCGATRLPISVAEHNVRVARFLKSQGHSRAVCQAGGIHDPEHIPPGDLPGPMVRLLEKRERAMRERIPDYEDDTLKIRRMGERAVWEALEVLAVFTSPSMASHIWHADRVLLATERRDLMAPSDVDRGPLPPPLPERIEPWSPERAWAEFQQMWDDFGGVRP